MPRKTAKPDSNARLKRKKGLYEKFIFMRVPSTLKDAIKQAAEYESSVRGHTVSENEWMTRAAIDRIGEIYGTSIARRFYQQFFNGLVAVHADITLPETNGTPLLTYK